MQFNQNELGIIKTLITRADIKGGEALTVAILMQKIDSLITPPEPTETPKSDGKEDKAQSTNGELKSDNNK